MSDLFDCMLCVQDGEDATAYVLSEGERPPQPHQVHSPQSEEECLPPFCQVLFIFVCVFFIFGTIIVLGLNWV